jgi:hypothetical protein
MNLSLSSSLRGRRVVVAWELENRGAFFELSFIVINRRSSMECRRPPTRSSDKLDRWVVTASWSKDAHCRLDVP